MEADKVKEAMAKRLVEAMEPIRAQEVILRVVAGEDVYDAILNDKKVREKIEKKKSVRKPRADKGKSRSAPPEHPGMGTTPA